MISINPSGVALDHARLEDRRDAGETIACYIRDGSGVRPYGRARELEADRLGLLMVAEPVHDPHDAVDLWRRMDRPGGGPAILSVDSALRGPR